MFGLDPCSNEVVLAKTFYSKSGFQTCTAKQAIKAIGAALDKINLTSDLLIHTDRAGCFTSRFYHDFINNRPFVIGSMSQGGKPQQNAVIERFHRSIKQQHKSILLPWPETVKTTRDFHNVVLKNITIYNNQAKPKKNLELSPSTAKDILLKSKKEVPIPCLALQSFNVKDFPGNLQAYSQSLDITEYKFEVFVEESRNFVEIDSAEYERQRRDKALLNSMDQTLIDLAIVKGTQDSIQTEMQEIKEISNDILSRLTDNPKVKSKGVPQRDALEIATFKAIMGSEKPPRTHDRSWGRFLITSSILFYSGLQLNEVAGLGEMDIQQIIDHKKISIYQKKVNRYRDVFFIEKGLYYIKKSFDEYKAVVFKKDSVLFPPPPFGLPNGDKSINLMNKFLSPFGQERNLVLKSHSFRVNFITSILRKHKVQQAKELIGHQDIRSTMAYSRYKMTTVEKNQILDDVLDE